MRNRISEVARSLRLSILCTILYKAPRRCLPSWKKTENPPMAMPLDLVLIRHGESEGNVAFGKSRQGDDSHFTPKFLTRHSSHWRLTTRGAHQARCAGDWLRENVAESFDRYYVSEYLRAME